MKRSQKLRKKFVSRAKFLASSWFAKRQVRKVASHRGEIVVGPWVSEVGFEILYWIPFLQWAFEKFGVQKEQVTIISRGGSELWYGNLGGKYLDVFDYMPLEEFKELDARRNIRRHMNFSPLDREIFKRAKNDLPKTFTVLHPSLMYRLFMPFWRQDGSIKEIKNYVKFNLLPKPEFGPEFPGLPKEYVAVKFYFSKCLPETEENKKAISSLVKDIAKKIPVVMLDTGLKVDDHSDFGENGAGNIYTIKNFINPRNNLDAQTKILAGAKAFVGTAGGFSYLAPMYGVTSLAVFAENNFSRNHLDVANRVFASPPFGSLLTVHLSRMEDIKKIL